MYISLSLYIYICVYTCFVIKQMVLNEFDGGIIPPKPARPSDDDQQKRDLKTKQRRSPCYDSTTDTSSGRVGEGEGRLKLQNPNMSQIEC